MQWALVLIAAQPLNGIAMNLEKIFADPGVVKLAYRTMDGDIVAMSQLIKSGVNVKAVGYQGMTLTHFALLARQNRPQTLKLLLDAGADPVSLRSDGENVPQYSVMRDNADVAVVQVLFDHGIGPNWRPPLGSTYENLSLLQAAISGHNMVIVRLLIHRGVDLNFVDPFDGSALHYALSATRFDIGAVLVDSGIDLTLKNNTSPEIKNKKAQPMTAIEYFCLTQGGRRGANALPEVAEGWRLFTEALARRGSMMPCRL